MSGVGFRFGDGDGRMVHGGHDHGLSPHYCMSNFKPSLHLKSIPTETLIQILTYCMNRTLNKQKLLDIKTIFELRQGLQSYTPTCYHVNGLHLHLIVKHSVSFSHWWRLWDVVNSFEKASKWTFGPIYYFNRPLLLLYLFFWSTCGKDNKQEV